MVDCCLDCFFKFLKSDVKTLYVDNVKKYYNVGLWDNVSYNNQNKISKAKCDPDSSKVI